MSTIFQSKDTGQRSAPVNDNDIARRKALEAAGWVPVTPEIDAEDRRRIEDVQEAVRARSGSRLDVPGFMAALASAGLMAAYNRLPKTSREQITEMSR